VSTVHGKATTDGRRLAHHLHLLTILPRTCDVIDEQEGVGCQCQQLDEAGNLPRGVVPVHTCCDNQHEFTSFLPRVKPTFKEGKNDMNLTAS
jgi:hypothetical protein